MRMAKTPPGDVNNALVEGLGPLASGLCTVAVAYDRGGHPLHMTWPPRPGELNRLGSPANERMVARGCTGNVGSL